MAKKTGRARAVVTIGNKYGMLTCISSYSGKSKQKHILGLYRCECGVTVKKRNCYVVSGHTTSCGCKIYPALLASNITHNKCGTREYRAWVGMRARCLSKAHKHYGLYGGRGIKICERWDDFSLFLEDMGKCPKGLTLERNDVNGNYEPSNCRWATWLEQSRNKRRTVKINGMTISEISEIFGFTYHKTHYLYRSGQIENLLNETQTSL